MDCKFFLDTNIIVDYLLPGREHHIDAKELLKEADGFFVQAFFSESVVNTAAYLVQKIINVQDLKILINDLVSFITVLPCTNIIIKHAYHNAKNDLEDAVLYQIALENNIDYFITGNKKDFKKIVQPSLPVFTAREMINSINKINNK
ncbi:MAG TPA: type II toxin-antitoxin system VapC family toxin [Parafilimonas sp.]|nr:type II toxin-antitoxin system VapC family toxin [Parafilimonas sp.]